MSPWRADQLFGEGVGDEYREAETFDIRWMVVLDIVNDREGARLAREQAGPDLGELAAHGIGQLKRRRQQRNAMR
jgi:hypothetical protein